jgi:hypothetical protein
VPVPFDSPFDANDEVSLAQQCVANCRRKTRCGLYCGTAGFSCLIAGGLFRSAEGILILPCLMLLLTGACFALAGFFYGMDYLFKFRRSGQGLFSVVSDTAFNAAYLLLVVIGFCLPSIHYGGHPMPSYIRDTDAARQIGLMLNVHAHNHHGKYPDDLDLFAKADNPAVFKESRFLFYQKDGKQLRWILTLGLTTDDNPNIILLRSALTDQEGDMTVYTIGHTAAYLKEPEKSIRVIDGKPMLRPGQ